MVKKELDKRSKIREILDSCDEEILKDYAEQFLLGWNEESINEQYYTLFGDEED